MSVDENVVALMRTIKGPGQSSEAEQKLTCAMDRLAEKERMLDLREQQLADCTRAMRDVAYSLNANADGIDELEGLPRVYGYADSLRVLAKALNAVRAGKAAQ